MSVLTFKSPATARWKRATRGGCILAISLSKVLRGSAQDTGALESNVGIVGGTVEDVNGACSGFEFRNLTLNVPYQVTATTIASRSSRSQRDANALCADRVFPGGYRRGHEYSAPQRGSSKTVIGNSVLTLRSRGEHP
jgi:hypothetical protein